MNTAKFWDHLIVTLIPVVQTALDAIKALFLTQ